jgi:hypothetical protein
MLRSNYRVMSRVLIAFLLMVATLAMGGSGDVWITASTENARIVDERVSKMLDRLSNKTYKDNREQLRIIFTRTQKEFLHRYKQYASMDELASGEFDCLTATSLFAEILGRTGYDYRIVETNYHIFLLVATSEGEVLIETTDRFKGFITSPGLVAARIQSYRDESPSKRDSKKTYEYNFDLYHEISTEQLAGLLYFNQAVSAYNSRNWSLCSERILMAERHCDSPRIKALASVLLCTAYTMPMTKEERQYILENLKRIETASGSPIASR